jgi:hypothetical protein
MPRLYFFALVANADSIRWRIASQRQARLAPSSSDWVRFVVRGRMAIRLMRISMTNAVYWRGKFFLSGLVFLLAPFS